MSWSNFSWARNLREGQTSLRPRVQDSDSCWAWWADWVLLSETLRHWHFLDLLPLLLNFHVLTPSFSSWTFWTWLLPSPLELSCPDILLFLLVFSFSLKLSSLDFLLLLQNFISWFLQSTTELSCPSAFPHLLNFYVFVSPSSFWNSILCTFLKVMLMLSDGVLLHFLNFHVLVSSFSSWTFNVFSWSFLSSPELSCLDFFLLFMVFVMVFTFQTFSPLSCFHWIFLKLIDYWR